MEAYKNVIGYRTTICFNVTIYILHLLRFFATVFLFKVKNNCTYFKASEILVYQRYRKDSYLGQSFFIFRFTDPPEPNFLEIEKKIKEIFFNFIFLFPSDSCQYSTEVQLCFLVLSFLLLPG